MRLLLTAIAACCLQPGTADAQARPAPVYSTARTSIGTLLADPRAKAVLVRHIPKIVGNSRLTLASAMTLRGIQSFAGGDLDDRTLARIDADLAKLGRPKAK